MKFDEVLKLRNKIDKLRDSLTAFSVLLENIDGTARLHVDSAQERLNLSSQCLDKVLVSLGRELVKK